MTPSTNIADLAHHDPRLVAPGTRAEALFATEPAGTLAILRIFGGQLAHVPRVFSSGSSRLCREAIHDDVTEAAETDVKAALPGGSA